jgi:hypothetical protein
MRAARKWPAADAEKRARQRERESEQLAAARKRWSVVRGSDGNVIRISQATRAALKNIASAKRRDSFQRRAEVFIASLFRDATTCKHGRQWPDNRCLGCIKCIENYGFGGPVGLPALEVHHLAGAYGEFRKGLDIGYAISLDWDSREDMDHLVDTLLHECVHWLDSYWAMARKQSGITGTHDCTFNARLADLRKRLGMKQPHALIATTTEN